MYFISRTTLRPALLIQHNNGFVLYLLVHGDVVAHTHGSRGEEQGRVGLVIVD
jgi:hypothetical protein